MTERHLRKAALTGIVVWLVSRALFAAVDPFYLDVYQRGMAHFAGGDYAAAARELRVAAFGFVDSLEQFETAHVHAAVAASKVAQDADARLSAQRVVAAERVTRTYARLALPEHVRTDFERIAKAALTPEEYAFLTTNGAAPPVRPAPQVVSRSVAPQRPTQPASRPTTQPPTPASQPAAPQPVPPQPQPAAPQPVPAQPVPPQPQPGAPTPAPTQPPTAQPPAPQPVASAPQSIAPQPAAPQPAAPQPAPQPAPATVAASSGPAGTNKVAPSRPPAPSPSANVDPDQALASGDLAAARAGYTAKLESPQLSHAELLKIGEGLYRARDFRGAVRALTRAGALAKGEEPYHYYLAVALYESGQYGAAKRELAAALPFIEVTPDVERYRAKIAGAIE